MRRSSCHSYLGGVHGSYCEEELGKRVSRVYKKYPRGPTSRWSRQELQDGLSRASRKTADHHHPEDEVNRLKRVQTMQNRTSKEFSADTPSMHPIPNNTPPNLFSELRVRNHFRGLPGGDKLPRRTAVRFDDVRTQKSTSGIQKISPGSP